MLYTDYRPVIIFALAAGIGTRYVDGILSAILILLLALLIVIAFSLVTVGPQMALEAKK